MLKDKAVLISELNKRKNIFYSLLEYIINNYLNPCFAKLPVFAPDSLPIIIWKTIIFFILLMEIFYIPMKISFDFRYEKEINQQL